jgi:hypothetical protein
MRIAVALAIAALGFAGSTSAQNLEPTVRRIVRAWERADVGTIGAIADRNGLSLDIGGQNVGPLQPRQAAAALRRLFDERETISVRAGMHKIVGGQPSRAFFEITWTTRTRGTSIPQRSTIFFAFVLDDEWRITEIRLIQ